MFGDCSIVLAVTPPRRGNAFVAPKPPPLVVDSDSQSAEMNVDVDVETGETPNFDRLFGVVTDGIVGALGGLVGTVVLTVGLLIGSSLGAFDTNSFAIIADLAGATLVVESNLAAVGYLIFLFGGMTVWPLLLASIGTYLPGDRFALKGIAFGMVLWTGFAPSFYTGQTGLFLGLYLFITFFAHVFYGFTLGSVFDYFSNRPDTLV